MNLLRFDLPLRHSAASRFLPWTIGGLLYLAVVALAVAAIADEALRLLRPARELVTVTLPSVEDGRAGEQKMAQAIDLLRRTRGVTSAVAVPPEELKALVEPWLGTPDSDLDLPLPRLIDVTLDPAGRARSVRPSRSGWPRWSKAPRSASKPWPATAPSARPRSFGRGAAPPASAPCSAPSRSPR